MALGNLSPDTASFTPAAAVASPTPVYTFS